MTSNKTVQLKAILAQLDHQPDDRLVSSLQDSLLETIKSENKKTALVQTSVPLTPSESTKLGKLISRQFPQVKKTTYVVNPQVIGGIRIQVGDYLLDDTLQAALEAMQKNLV